MGVTPDLPLTCPRVRVGQGPTEGSVCSDLGEWRGRVASQRVGHEGLRKASNPVFGRFLSTYLVKKREKM